MVLTPPHSKSKLQDLLVLAEKGWHHTNGIEPATLVLGQFHNSSLELTEMTVVVYHLPGSMMGPAKKGSGIEAHKVVQL